MNNWHNVKNGSFPPVGEYVLIVLDGEVILKGQLLNDGWVAFFSDGLKSTRTRVVTHWMPLPVGPNEKDVAVNPDRAKIAAMALQGLLANPDYNCPSRPKDIVTATGTAMAALHYADALLKELSKTQP